MKRSARLKAYLASKYKAADGGEVPDEKDEKAEEGPTDDTEDLDKASEGDDSEDSDKSTADDIDGDPAEVDAKPADRAANVADLRRGDNEAIQSQAPVAPTEDQKLQAMKDYLAKQYDKAADTSGIQAAMAKLHRDNVIGNIGAGLEQMATARGVANGMKPDDGSFWQGIKAQGQRGVEQATAQRQQSIQSFIQQNEMQRQVAQDMMAKGTYDQQQKAAKFLDDRNDPTSTTSKNAQAAFKQTFADDPNLAGMDVSGFSSADLADASKNIDVVARLKELAEAARMRRDMMRDRMDQAAAGKKASADAKVAADLKKANTKFGTDYTKEANKYHDQIAKIDDANATIDQAVQAGGGIASAVVPAALAKSIVNRVTQQEINQFSGDPSVIERIKALWSKAANGTMTVQNAKEYKALLASQRATADATWARKSGGMISTHARTTGQDESDIHDLVSGPAPQQQGGQGQQPPAASKYPVGSVVTLKDGTKHKVIDAQGNLGPAQ